MKFRMLVASVLACLIVFLNFSPTFASTKDVFYTDKVAVLVYHHLDDQESSSVTISPQLFKRQLQYLKRRGFEFITLDQFKAFKQDGKQIPDNAILVTFDDGYESFFTYAYPILKKLQIPAVNFVITKDLDDPKKPKLAALSPEEITQIRQDDPDIEFQCHSDHLHAAQDGKPMLSNKLFINGVQETDDVYKKRVVDDTKSCMSKLTSLNAATKVDAYAYPFGSYTETTMAQLQEAGIQFAFTTKAGLTSRDLDSMQIPRINAGSPYVRPHSINNLINQAMGQHDPKMVAKNLE
ncbi:polysaccharide deacetylase family protein [Paenibacillus roseipurpureus]|uniref:Polysaccharide deacetylase family protein n=1 Tax=Paenibacillus roseopurpureus TaxID=2918901 RepID=A0AA96LMG1_9BACL|nr:polysaccharide deacetylase family protein [Paenibacillus sp. MBLB1832]WNR42433.1 polysaccharide deacetylase family protein [Paenibacillus sp. MBLB1832]